MPSEVERLRRSLRALSAAVGAFARADYAHLLEVVAREGAEVIGDSCLVFLQGPDGELRAEAIHDPDPVIDAQFHAVFHKDLGVTTARTPTLRENRSVLAPSYDVETAQLPPPVYELYKRLGVRGALAVPMMVQGTQFGVLAVIRHREHDRVLDELDLELAEDLASHAALAYANAQLVRDLSDRDEVRRAKEALARANTFLDAIIENIPDMVFVKDADRLAFTRFNRAGEQLIGRSRDAMLGKTDNDFFPPEEAMHFQAMDQQTLRAGKLVEIAEEPILTAAGRRWLHTKKVPILDENGIPRYLLGISSDITEQKLQQLALVEAKEKAEAANRELEAFSYSVAHDLRAPLRGIDGFSQAILEDYGDKLDEDGLRMLRRVREQAQRMALLIDDLLALSRVTRHEVVPEDIDLGALAHETIERLRRAEPARQVDVVIAPTLWAHGDPRMLAIAFDNLLGNAWKFTSKTSDARIEIGRVFEAGERRFYVRDNGAGFDPTYGHKLFGVFQRLHTEQEFPGTGIGLATVARIILRHRGRVWAEGNPGMGATFYFTLGEAEAV